MAVTKTLVKDCLILLAGIEEDLGLPTKWQKQQAWNKLVDRLSEPLARAQIKYLEKSGYLKRGKSKESIIITPRGWQRIALEVCDKFGKRSVQGPLKYIIVFDIPEERRRIRDLLRESLIVIGFRFLQQSIFITNSLDAFRFSEQLVKNCGLKKYVHFIEAKKLW